MIEYGVGFSRHSCDCGVPVAVPELMCDQFESFPVREFDSSGSHVAAKGTSCRFGVAGVHESVLVLSVRVGLRIAEDAQADPPVV